MIRYALSAQQTFLAFGPKRYWRSYNFSPSMIPKTQLKTVSWNLETHLSQIEPQMHKDLCYKTQR